MIEELTVHVAVAPGSEPPGVGDTIHAFTASTEYTVSIHGVLSQTEPLAGIVALKVLAVRERCGDEAQGEAKS